VAKAEGPRRIKKFESAMNRRSRLSLPRREFMRRAAAVSAAMATPAVAAAPSSTPTPVAPAADAPAADSEALTGGRAGSDFMVDTIKALGFEYVCANPGSSFRGLHESIINYGGNQKPELITCMHEESAVAMAHGYFKIEGKPLAVVAHGTVGLQHASMAIYNAWCDRVPVYVLLGNTLDASMRAPGVEWVDSVQDAAAMVRDYTKWDDTPVSLGHFGESAVRAYKVCRCRPTPRRSCPTRSSPTSTRSSSRGQSRTCRRCSSNSARHSPLTNHRDTAAQRLIGFSLCL
jgi:acetolactate synthase I/II/III large subunit